jgi:hypothetical protein
LSIWTPVDASFALPKWMTLLITREVRGHERRVSAPPCGRVSPPRSRIPGVLTWPREDACGHADVPLTYPRAQRTRGRGDARRPHGRACPPSPLPRRWQAQRRPVSLRRRRRMVRAPAPRPSKRNFLSRSAAHGQTLCRDPVRSVRSLRESYRPLGQGGQSERWDRDVAGIRRSIIRKLREADRLLGEGQEVATVAKQLEVSEQTLHRWRHSTAV